MKKAAIYTRVSTLDQAQEGYSLDAQENALRNWCECRNIMVHDIYADRGISGRRTANRPEFNRLMADAQNGKFDIVLFWALSRFTRSVSDLYQTVEKLKKCKVAIASYTEAIDTSTPAGRAMLGVLGVFAQLESELTAERTALGMAERARQGKRTCNELLGYDAVGKDGWVVNEKEAEYVRFCFASYLENKYLSKVAREASFYGYHGKRGARPTPYHIQLILTNPAYCGYNRFNDGIYKGTHEPIVTVETFNKVQRMLMKQGKKYGRTRKQKIQVIVDK